jgi:hypothetical protein
MVKDEMDFTSVGRRNVGACAVAYMLYDLA